MGIGKNGEKTDGYEPGMELLGKQTIFAEGCRGHLTKALFDKFDLREGKDPRPMPSASRSCGISIGKSSRAQSGIPLAGLCPPMFMVARSSII